MALCCSNLYCSRINITLNCTQVVMEKESVHTTYPDQLVGPWKELSKQVKTGAPGCSGTQSGWHMPGMVCVWMKGFVAEVCLSPGAL